MIGKNVELITSKEKSNTGKVVLDVKALNWINEKNISTLKNMTVEENLILMSYNKAPYSKSAF